MYGRIADRRDQGLDGLRAPGSGLFQLQPSPTQLHLGLADPDLKALLPFGRETAEPAVKLS